MAWIKRNLFFVLGAVVSLALLVFAGYYTYTGWQHKEKESEYLNDQFRELTRLKKLEPHPGFAKVDNIKLAGEQQKEIRTVLGQAAKQFQPPALIPTPADGTNISSSQYSAALRETLSQLTRAAAQASVQLPPDFKFSFTQQLRLLTFAEGSLEPLARQLGEVKALCEVLIKAKVNSLDALQRERVSTDDAAGPQTDYLLDAASQSNELAVLTPYDVTFRSFSHEIAEVLAALANSPHGFIVQGLNVEPAAPTALEQPGFAPEAPPPYYGPLRSMPTARPTPRSTADEEAAEAAALRPDLYKYTGPSPTLRPGYTPPPTYAPPPGYGSPTPGGPVRSASATGLDETQLRVTMRVQVVKLLTAKK